MLKNLIKTAVEAIKIEKGIVSINTNISPDQVYFTIYDNGEGVPKEVLPEIFIPFFTTKEEVSGIQLRILRQIVRNHNRTLKISSKTNKGTICKLNLLFNNFD